jgi:hypothetical protein
MRPDHPLEFGPGRQLNPSARPPPRVYQRSHQRDAGDEGRMVIRDLLLTFLAISTALGFATLCAVIA